jgi:ribosomal protein S18 acetylase RimI-like enzyme
LETQRQGETLLPLGDEPSAARFLPATVPLVHEAAQTYFDWLFGGPNDALAHLDRWLRRPSSEVALERVILLLERDLVQGAYVALSGADLAACRKADGRALLTNTPRDGRPALLRRLGAVRSLFAPVAADEWYLSKLAIAPAARGRGLGGRLVEAYLDQGAAAGFTRYRLDVEADNAGAVKLYAAHGFRVMHEASSDSAKMRYLGMTMEARRAAG